MQHTAQNIQFYYNANFSKCKKKFSANIVFLHIYKFTCVWYDNLSQLYNNTN